MKRILTAALTFLILSSCGKGGTHMKGYDNKDIVVDEPVGNSDVASVVEEKAEAPATVRFPPPVVKEDMEVLDNQSRPGDASPVNIDKKIIKEGEIHFKTEDINQTRKILYASLKKLGGYVAEESENNYSEVGQKEITLQTRIPAKNFDAFLINVSSNAETIDSKNIRIKDVTTEYIDVTTRLANKKKLEERYLELLKKGSKISDLLEIENKLTDIRSDIESTQGQLNYMMKQVAYSTIDVTFYSRQTVQDNGQTFGYKIKRALSGGWQTLGSLFFAFIEWWPIWLILAGLIYLFRRWRKKRRQQNNARKS